jgi:hypothetical protein
MTDKQKRKRAALKAWMQEHHEEQGEPIEEEEHEEAETPEEEALEKETFTEINGALDKLKKWVYMRK